MKRSRRLCTQYYFNRIFPFGKTTLFSFLLKHAKISEIRSRGCSVGCVHPSHSFFILMETSLSHRVWLKPMRILVSTVTVLSMLAPSLSFADDRYWIGNGTSRNDWHDVANWGLTFSATATGSSVPGVNDIAFFDEVAEGNAITIRNNVNVKGIRLGAQFTGSIIAYSGAIIRVGSGGIKMGS